MELPVFRSDFNLASDPVTYQVPEDIIAQYLALHPAGHPWTIPKKLFRLTLDPIHLLPTQHVMLLWMVRAEAYFVCDPPQVHPSFFVMSSSFTPFVLRGRGIGSRSRRWIRRCADRSGQLVWSAASTYQVGHCWSSMCNKLTPVTWKPPVKL